MTERNFATALKDEADGTGFSLELQPLGKTGADTVTTIELKVGATKDQAAELQSQLNLLGVRLHTTAKN